MAIQQLYGAPVAGPLSGGQRYGFNTNITGALKDFFDFTVNTKPLVTLYNSGTGNVLDVSGFAVAQTIDLAAGAFSSIAGLTNNLAIALGTRIDSAFGGSGNDTILANANGDRLSGGLGTNILTGGTGFDFASYETASAGVTVSLAIAGAQVTGGAGTDTLTSIEGLIGSAYADTLTGDGNTNTLDGGGGADTLTGGGGNDTYVVGNAGVTVVESAGGGYDTVRTTVSNYVLPANVERLVYTGSVAQTFVGTAGADDITGGSGNDFFDLSGGADDIANGGLGNDGFLFGAAFTAADRIDGGGGSDQIGLQGNYTGANALILGATTIANIEAIAALAGFSYAITTNDANVAAGQVLAVYGSSLGATDNLAFNGSAELDGQLLVYGGLGVDTITTGAGNDGIYFGRDGRFGASDHVDGGAGTDQLALDGSYTLTISSAQIVNVETLVLLDSSATPAVYNITLADDWTAAGQSRIIYAVGIRAGAIINGAAESSGKFVIYGGLRERYDHRRGRGGLDLWRPRRGPHDRRRGRGHVFLYSRVAIDRGGA